MADFGMDQNDLFVMYPNAKEKLENWSEEKLRHHRELLSPRRLLLQEIESSHHKLYQTMMDCLRLDPRDRSLSLCLSNY
jgi:hypothetical protein